MLWIRIVSFRTAMLAAAFSLGCGVSSTEPEIRWQLHPGTVELSRLFPCLLAINPEIV